ncbi:MAG: hypothetical protein CMJ75_14280 [Planctomycetaceae bacterium]|nr:hypothetical protein [Planctomycetaceae bacterium]
MCCRLDWVFIPIIAWCYCSTAFPLSLPRWVSVASAAVSRIEIIERRPFADGQEFGSVGAYEYIRGRLHYAIAPDHPRNQAVVDLQLATQGRLRSDLSRVESGRIMTVLGGDPRDAHGRVQFAGDFILLKPVDLSRGNHRLLYDVNNRGNLLMLSYYNNAPQSNRPSGPAAAGNGWLMRQGYTLLWSAWNWDVEKVGQQPLRIFLPVVMNERGAALTGLVNAELSVVARDGQTVQRLAWGGSRCYPADVAAVAQATLSVRSGPDAPRRVLPRQDWKFASVDGRGKPRFDARHVYLPSGFERGKLYEVIYRASEPRVVGLGLTAVRDAISFFRFETRDAEGQPNPLAVAGSLDSQFAYIFGISQSGRFITHMIYQGFHVDEAGRLVIDGARPHVAGGGKGGFNYRFAQTTHHAKHLQGNYFPADHFPFHYTPDGQWQVDLAGQPGRQQGDLFAVGKQLGKLPRIMISNHEGEYWTRSASLVHTDVAGRRDAQLHPLVRVYMVNGCRHGAPGRGSRRFARGSQHAFNQLDPRPVGRALLVALDDWVSRQVLPPASRVPRIERGELVTAQQHRETFPAIPARQIGGFEYPAPRHPGVNLRPPRIDYGPRFWTAGIQDFVPPRQFGSRMNTLVPAVDRDGNPQGGIQLPQLSVPLGTYQGFNPRHSRIGGAGYLKAFESSFWPFATLKTERLQHHDPRKSIEERYASHSVYVEQIGRAATVLANERLLLAEDVTQIVDFARRLHWPPVPTNGWPFWKISSARSDTR